jgi:hypothetical protein
VFETQLPDRVYRGESESGEAAAGGEASGGRLTARSSDPRGARSCRGTARSSRDSDR